MTSTGVNISTVLPVRQLRQWVSYAETWPWLQIKPRLLHIGTPSPTEINRMEKVQRTAACWACRHWRNQSHAGEMLDELQWPKLQERRWPASLTFSYKVHNNPVIIDKNRYLSEVSRGNRSTRSQPFQYHHPNAFREELKFSFFPRTITYNRSCLYGDSWWV